jgi:hypothetical protein
MTKYDFTVDVTDDVFGSKDAGVVLFADFECQVEVYINDTGDDLEMYCTGVFVDGSDLSHGGELSKAIAKFVTKKVDDDLSFGGDMFERIRDEEGYYFDGNPGDPDACWRQH